MPTISLTTSVTANTRSANVLAGSVFEFMRRAGIVSILASTTAVGVVANANIGGEQIADGALVPATSRYPIVPDDRIVVSGAAPGERLFLTYLNETAGTLVITTLVEIAET